MDKSVAEQAGVIEALTERLSVLAEERDALAARARDLEAALAATSVEAQRRAAEAVHLQALIDFYEQDPPNDRATAGEAVQPRPQRDDQDGDAAAGSAPSIRRAGAAWTTAWRDAAVAALQAHGAPMHYRDLYRLLAGRGFTFGGQSPEATFLASLHRNRGTFQSAGKGTYWLVEAAPGDAHATAARARRRTRRPRPIGKTKGAA